MQPSRRAGLWIALCACLPVGAALADPGHHVTVLEGARPLPRRLLALPPEVPVHEVTAGGVVEKVPAQTEAATRRFTKAIAEAVAAAGPARLQLVPMPALDAGESDAVADFVANYDMVALAIAQASQGGEAWKPRLARFDYSLGEGLPALADKAGADAVLIVTGRARTETAGRKWMNAYGTYASIMSLGLVGGQQRGAGGVVSMGVVDLRTGDIVWFGGTEVSLAEYLEDGPNRAFVARMVRRYLDAPAKP